MIQIGWVVKTINITSKQPINCKINMWAYSWSQNACNVCASFMRTKCMVKYPLHKISFECNSKPTWLAPKYNTNDITNNVSHSLIKHTKLILYIEGPKGGAFNFFMVSTQISFATFVYSSTPIQLQMFNGANVNDEFLIEAHTKLELHVNFELWILQVILNTMVIK